MDFAMDLRQRDAGRSGLARWRIMQQWLLGQLLEIRSTWSVSRTAAASRVIDAFADWQWVSDDAYPRVEAALFAGEIPALADVLAVEDLLRDERGRRSRACVILAAERDERSFGAELAADGVVTIGLVTRGGWTALDRGRMSATGYLVQIGGSAQVPQDVYVAIETAFRRWL